MPASRMRSQQATSKRYKNESLLHQNLTLPSSASTYASAYRSLEVPALLYCRFTGISIYSMGEHVPTGGIGLSRSIPCAVATLLINAVNRSRLRVHKGGWLRGLSTMC